MAEFAYNNAKNASTGHTFFKLNYGYHPHAFYKENLDPHSQSKSAEELVNQLRDLITICKENFYYV